MISSSISILHASAALVLLVAGCGAAKAAEQAGAGVSGLPVPRFVSLKTDRVNVRAGPTKDHEVTFVFTRAGLPVEIIGEFENWRRIRDWEGGEGWVYHSLLSGKRNVVVSSKSKSEHELIAVHESADAKSDVTARLQPGVLGQIKRCQANFCRVMGLGFDGWVAQERLWGVYPNESVD